MPSSLSYTLSLHDALPIFPARSRILDHRTEVVAAEVVRQLQPEPGELHADAGLEAAALDVGEDVLVGADDRRRLLLGRDLLAEDRKSTRLNSSHMSISYAVLPELHSFPTRRSSDLSRAKPHPRPPYGGCRGRGRTPASARAR